MSAYLRLCGTDPFPFTILQDEQQTVRHSSCEERGILASLTQ
jgi:hypothetical protein